MEDEELLLVNYQSTRDAETLLSDGELTKSIYYFVPTIWFIPFEITSLIAYALVVFIKWDDSSFIGAIDALTLKSSLAVGMFLLFIVLYVIKRSFHRRARQRGYLAFYRKVRTPTKLPIILWAFCLACIVLILAVWPKNFQLGPLQSLNGLQVVVSATILGIVPVLLYYSVIVYQHNKARNLPDASSSLAEPTSGSQRFHAGQLQIGLVDDEAPPKSKDDNHVVETQAEYIRYLHEQKANLNKTIIDLKANIYTLEKQNRSAPSLRDVDQVLLAKDQEIRALNRQIQEKERQIQTLQQPPPAAGPSVMATPPASPGLRHSNSTPSLASPNGANLNGTANGADLSVEFKKLKDMYKIAQETNETYQSIIAKQRQEIEKLVADHEEASRF